MSEYDLPTDPSSDDVVIPVEIILDEEIVAGDIMNTMLDDEVKSQNKRDREEDVE